MEHHLRLVKGLSYSGAVYATKREPDVVVPDGDRYRVAMASGYFEEISIPRKDVARTPEKSMEMPCPAEEFGNQDKERTPGKSMGQRTIGRDASGQDGKTPHVSGMTLEELKAYALISGIDISGLRKKDDILAAVEDAERKAAEARVALRMG